MLTNLLGKLIKRGHRHWTEGEIRELITAGAFERALAATHSLHPATPEKELQQLCLQAEIAFRTHRDADAEALYNQVLTHAPGFADAHYGLSLLHLELDKVDSAFQHALFAKNLRPQEPRYLAQLGLCHIRLGNFPAAEAPLRQAVRYSPDDKSAWNNLGIAQLAKGKLDEARNSFNSALRLDPGFRHAQDNLAQLEQDQREQASQAQPSATLPGALTTLEAAEAKDRDADPPWHDKWQHVQALAEQGQTSKALADAERLLEQWPNDAEMTVRLNGLYRALGEPDSGMSVLQAFAYREPTNGKVQLALGTSLLEDGQPAEAETHLRRAQALMGNTGLLLRQLGVSLTKQERHAEADEVYATYHEAYPSDVSLGFRASSFVQTCQYDKALELLEQLNAGGYIQKHRMENLYVSALAYSGQLERALDIVNGLEAQLPNAPTLRSTRAQILLQLEQFGQGWDDYRYRNFSYSKFFRVLPVPEWQGEPLVGKTIVVLAEQGLGDQVMFASCIPDLLALSPNHLVVEAVDRVAPTLARSFPQCEVISTQQDKRLEWLRNIENVDYFVPIGELPRHFRRSLASFPRRSYLKPNSKRVHHWRTQLEKLGPGPYLGTSWRGGTEQTRTAIRTLSPDLLRPLVTALPAQWVCLQYGTKKQLQEELTVASQGGVHMTHWAEAIADLDEFAALLAALDGVFTVCNTTVHYAGAVGQKTWVLAPTVPEWRYGLHNPAMPWYPNVEVLRQPSPNAWEPLIEQARRRLIDNYCRQSV